MDKTRTEPSEEVNAALAPHLVMIALGMARRYKQLVFDRRLSPREKLVAAYRERAELNTVRSWMERN